MNLDESLIVYREQLGWRSLVDQRTSEEMTLGIIKPDGMPYKWDIARIIEESGLRIVESYIARADSALVIAHYAEVLQRVGGDIGMRLIDYMTSSEIMPLLLKGDNAVQVLRQLSGDKSDPSLCAEGTLRRRFSNDTMAKSNLENRAVRNVMHTSDSLKSAEAEIGIWFPHRNTYETRAGVTIIRSLTETYVE